MRLALYQPDIPQNTGTILRMPGLPRSPQAMRVRLNADGTVEGVS